MRGNIIEELYYGNIDPQDRGYHPQSPVKKVSDSLNDLEEKLTEQLAGENKALFLRFCNVYAEFMGESELDTFITGFRLGARFMMDSPNNSFSNCALASAHSLIACLRRTLA